MLLVEDEGLIRLVAAEVLQGEGFEVVEAWDGDEAARLLSGPGTFDVLFTDVRMPGVLDGVDVAIHAPGPASRDPCAGRVRLRAAPHDTAGRAGTSRPLHAQALHPGGGGGEAEPPGQGGMTPVLTSSGRPCLSAA